MIPDVPRRQVPRFTGRFAFLIDGRVLSFAESLMGIVEDEHLGALVGGPTAGTNGGIDPFGVAGGYTLRWTGMDIRKKDGSPHLGVGIQPTVPVRRTLAVRKPLALIRHSFGRRRVPRGAPGQAQRVAGPH